MGADRDRRIRRREIAAGDLTKAEGERRKALRGGSSESTEKIRTLSALRGIGEHGACILTAECFGWHTFRNRRQLGAFAGLTPTPFSSSMEDREQGISKAGNKQPQLDLQPSNLKLTTNSAEARGDVRADATCGAGHR